VPTELRSFIPLNARLAQQWRPITRRKPPPPDADAWARAEIKRHLLQE
jgi:ferredoxin